MNFPKSAKVQHLIIALDTVTNETVFEAIIGGTDNAHYCSLFDRVNWRETIKRAGGWGYHRGSAALYYAMEAAGLTGDVENFAGRGYSDALYWLNKAAENLTGHKCEAVDHYIWH